VADIRSHGEDMSPSWLKKIKINLKNEEARGKKKERRNSYFFQKSNLSDRLSEACGVIVGRV
jgi:hypothetical protein